MIMIKKITITLFLLFLLVGIASATDYKELKVPDGWESMHNGNYHELGDSPGQGSGRNIMIMEYNNANCADFLENNSEDNYFIYKNSDGSYNYTDEVINYDIGCFEVVKIDGKEYFVLFSSNIGKSYDGTINDIMLEFNKLNNLKPIEV